MRSVGVNDAVVEQLLSSSPYLMKQKMKSNAEEMKGIFKEVGPELFDEGYMWIEIDHKSIIKETNDPEKHGFGVIAVLCWGDYYERYMMAFIATDKTDTETNEKLLESCLEVCFLVSLHVLQICRNMDS